MNMISRGERSEQRLTILINTLFYSCIMDFLFVYYMDGRASLRSPHPDK